MTVCASLNERKLSNLGNTPDLTADGDTAEMFQEVQAQIENFSQTSGLMDALQALGK